VAGLPSGAAHSDETSAFDIETRPKGDGVVAGC
jgi:hypothetical protein